ncbi:MAG: NAD(P)/FAD-dependent oxidoreductase [Sulfolobales archaeon]
MGEILVVGGGFSGLLLASRIPGSEVFEENHSIGVPPHCTGLVSWDTIKIIGAPARESIVSSYRYIRVLNTAGEDMVILKPSQRIYKLDRILLEKLLAREAEDIGSKIHTRAKVLSVDLGGSVVIHGKGGFKRVAGSLVAIAEGSLNNISRKLGLSRKQDLLVGVQGYINISRDIDEEEILVFVDDRIFRGFFGWLVPLGDGEAIAGMASKLGDYTNMALRIYLLVLRRLGYLRGNDLRGAYGGLIVRGYPLMKHYRGRVIAIGDSAGFAKPFSGGGLYPASRQVEALIIALRRSEDEEALKRYSKLIRDEIRSLRLQWIATKAVEAIGIERAIKILAGLGIRSISMDYDHHEKVLPKLLLEVLAENR